MFGYPCYQTNCKLFAFFVTNGIVIIQLEQADKEILSREHQTAFFQTGRKIVKDWG